jgi:hypothetical protein
MPHALTKSGRLGASVLAGAVLALTLPGTALAAHLPDVNTGPVTHVHGTGGLLTGTVNPQGSPTTFYFQFGPTTAYGRRTATNNAGSGTKPIKVGLTAAPMLPGYHYRLVATNAAGTKLGKDREYQPKLNRVKIDLARTQTVPYRALLYVAGRMTGAAAANHRIALQASPWPYREGFEQIGRPTVTNAAGRFAFRVGALSRNTEFRVITLDPLPRISRVLTVHVTVRVNFRMRASGKPGFVRLFGTVTPASVGHARVLFQVLKEAKPGRTEKTEERTTRFATVEITKLKHGTRKFSYFSAIVSLKHGGLYRAVVSIRSGPLSTGSSRGFVIGGTPPHHHAKKH